MASLETYIRKVLQPSDRRPRVFNDVPGVAPPTLSRDHTNRILIFNGCFNPPHRGHLALLEHAFHHCGEDLHVIAAVVLVASEEYLRWKFCRAGDRDVHLSDAQRIQLWEGELGARDINWCLVYRECDWWSQVAARLERDFKRDGFEVEFVRIAGGDRVSRRLQAHGQWGCRTLITSDVCRRVDFFGDGEGEGASGGDGDGSPATLKNHGPWAKVQVADDILRELARHRVLHSLGLDSGGVPEEEAGEEASALARRIDEEYLRCVSVRDKRRLWTCDYRGNSRGYTLRFIASDDHLSPDISSTNLRNIIANTELSELEDKLQGVALSPALLTRFIFARAGI